MPFGTFIAPSPDADFVELGATRKGRLFKKHILNKGTLYHPKTGEAINVDDTFVNTLKSNFENGVCDIVQVPLANDKNEHSEAPDRNIGRVVGIEADGDKVYAMIDARKHADDLGETLLGASAMMSLDYTDTKTLERKGPTLLHVAVTNRPYVTGLEEYEEVVAASAEYSSDTVVLTPAAPAVAKEAKDMNKTELLAALKALKGDDAITAEDLKGLGIELPKGEAAPDATLTALTQTLANTGLVQLSAGDQITGADVVNAVAQLAQNNLQLSNTVGELTKDKARTYVHSLVEDARILPAQEEAMLTLYMTNRELFDQIVPEKPLVTLSAESGITPPDPTPQIDVESEISRYLEMASQGGTATG